MTVRTIIAVLALAVTGTALGSYVLTAATSPDPAPVAGTWGVADSLQTTLRRQHAAHRARVDELQPKLDRRQARVDRLLGWRQDARHLRSAALQHSRETTPCDEGGLKGFLNAIVLIITLGLVRPGGDCLTDAAVDAGRAAVRHGDRIRVLTKRLVQARGRLVSTRRTVQRERRGIEVTRAKARAASRIRSTGVTCELRGGVGSASLKLHNDNDATVTAVVRVPRIGSGAPAAREHVTLAAGEQRAVQLNAGVISDPALWTLSAGDCAPRLVALRLPSAPAAASARGHDA